MDQCVLQASGQPTEKRKWKGEKIRKMEGRKNLNSRGRGDD